MDKLDQALTNADAHRAEATDGKSIDYKRGWSDAFEFFLNQYAVLTIEEETEHPAMLPEMPDEQCDTCED